MAAGICKLARTTGGGSVLEKIHTGKQHNTTNGLKDTEMSDQPIGANTLPLDVQQKLGEFVDWLDERYEAKNGSTALYWGLSYFIAEEIVPK